MKWSKKPHKVNFHFIVENSFTYARNSHEPSQTTSATYGKIHTIGKASNMHPFGTWGPGIEFGTSHALRMSREIISTPSNTLLLVKTSCIDDGNDGTIRSWKLSPQWKLMCQTMGAERLDPWRSCLKFACFALLRSCFPDTMFLEGSSIWVAATENRFPN